MILDIMLFLRYRVNITCIALSFDSDVCAGEVEAALTDMEAAVILDPNNAEFTLGLESTRQLQRQLR